MIDFAFTPEQDAFRDMLRRFALSELLPLYGRGDRRGDYPREQIKRIIALIGDEADSREDNLIYAGIVAEEVARWLSYKILWLRQNEQRCDREGAMAKWWVPKIAGEIIHECLLLHGHYGYTKDFPIEQRLRDVIGWQIGDGTPQIQKLILARLIFGKEYGGR